MLRIIVILSILFFSSAQECKDTGYVCSDEGSSYWCSWWVKDAICHNGKCMTPTNCQDSTSKSNQNVPVCKDTGYICSEKESPGSEYCEQYADNSVCSKNTCYTPRNCDVKNAQPSTNLKVKRELATLEELLTRLEAPGEDQDDVPDRFTDLIKNMESDTADEFGGDMSIENAASVFISLGYKNTEVRGPRMLSTQFDDEINILKGGLVFGKMHSDSFSLSTCIFDNNDDVNNIERYMLVNAWNQKFRLTKGFLRDKDPDLGNSFCLESDTILTKYAKANVQILKEAAAYFIISTQVYHEMIKYLFVAKAKGEF